MLAILVILSACAEASPAPCPGWQDAVAVGQVVRPEVDEASGLAASRVWEDLLWTHNDKGGEPVLYALGHDGRDRGALTLEQASAEDWEDLALGVSADGQAALYVGDIGDNTGLRTSLRVWRVPEPEPPDADRLLPGAEALDLAWPGAGVDAEGLAVDPMSNDLLVFSKEAGRTRVFRASAHAEDGSSQVLQEVGEVDLADAAFDGGHQLTAADFSPAGDRLLLRTASAVLVLTRERDEPVAELLATVGCTAPAPEEPDGEAIAATADGFFTVSEGAGPALWSVAAP